MNDDARTRPVTDEQRRRAEQTLARLKRDLAEADRRNLPPSLAPEPRAHQEQVRPRDTGRHRSD